MAVLGGSGSGQQVAALVDTILGACGVSSLQHGGPERCVVLSNFTNVINRLDTSTILWQRKILITTYHDIDEAI